MNDETGSPQGLFNPFPGLRPFNRDESHLFFGREGQSRSVLQSLKAHNFVAVIGASGSGKSSLIYCGVIPELLGDTKQRWVAISSRPGSNPLDNLVYSIREKYGDEIEEDATEKLLSGDLQFNLWVNKLKKKDESFLLVIDQFEEVFRYKKTDQSAHDSESVVKFVEIIHQACSHADNPVSIVLTMRSDFIGECAIFQDLTELINRSNYLIPQMTREDFRKAIEGPVRVGGAKIEKELVAQLLEELADNTDQLPVLQHALMRTWDYWALQNNREKPISAGDYEAIGRMEKALSDHANEAYDELNEEQRIICELLFKTITEKGGDNRGVRRPAKISRVAEVARCQPGEIIQVAEVFREKGRTFLTPFHPVQLDADTVVDISHESLMRIWDRLRLWVDEEANSVQMYLKLSEAAELYQEGTAGLWRPPDLQLALNWRENQQPTLTWAVQYNPAFERAMVYLDTSEAEFKKEEENKIRLQRRRLRVTRMFSLVLGGIAVVAMGLFIWTRDLRNQAEAGRAEAEEQRLEAEKQTVLAQRRLVEADSANNLAQLRLEQANAASLLAQQRAQEARDAQFEAESQRNVAEEQRVEAQEATRKAEKSAEEARIAQEEAQRQADLAEQRRMLSIAQSMAIKSTQMRTDTLLKGLLAYQAFAFNEEYEGLSYDPDVFSAIYSAVKYFRGVGYNILDGHASTVGSVIDHQGKILSASSEGKIITWNPADTGFVVNATGLPTIIKAFYNDSHLICLTNRSIIRFGEDGEEADVFAFPLYQLNDLIPTREGKYILVYNNSMAVTDDYKVDGSTFYEADSKINEVLYCSENGMLAVALSDGRILYWDSFQTGERDPALLAQQPNASWSALGYLEQRNMLAAGTGNSQGSVYLYDLPTGKELNSLRGHNAKVTEIIFSQKGDLMASSSYDGSVNLWRVDDLNTLPVRFTDHTSWVTSIAFTDDDLFVISGDRDGKLSKLPTEMPIMLSGYCDFLTRNLSENEWQNYVGQDIEYKPANCNQEQ